MSIALLVSAVERGLLSLHIKPDKPSQNDALESCNGKFRDECLGMSWFYSRAHAKVLNETWRMHCNLIWLHSS